MDSCVITTYVGEAVVEFDGPVDGAARVRGAEVVQPVEHRTIRELPHVEFLHLEVKGWSGGDYGSDKLALTGRFDWVEKSEEI